MNKIIQLSISDGEEAWLFADLFASLLMTFMLLINVESLATTPKNIVDSGSKNIVTQLIYLVDEQHVKLGSHNNQPVLISAAIKKLQTSHVRAEIVGSKNDNGLELFKMFRLFEKAGIGYNYSIDQGVL